MSQSNPHYSYYTQQQWVPFLKSLVRHGVVKIRTRHLPTHANSNKSKVRKSYIVRDGYKYIMKENHR